MYGVNTTTIAGAAGVFGALTYLLFFLLLLSANIALWKYIVTSNKKYQYWDEKGVDKRDRGLEDRKERK